MNNIKVFDNPDILANESAKLSVDILKKAISDNGYAVWVLSGGSTPINAYRIISDKFSNYLDWLKVYFILGDERTVDIDDDLSNWKQIDESLNSKNKIIYNVLLPSYSKDNIKDAEDYSLKISNFFKNKDNSQIDLLWLGCGDDGHTLSLFPGHTDINNLKELVLPINNSPKPPSSRISLGLTALTNVKNCFAIVSGSSKKSVWLGISQNDKSIPIVQVVDYLLSNNAKVTWLLDKSLTS
ncbi:MAG TPA: 6-phosphogluconolactonase [Patescibacteria group bacterium]|nr:6-phosphogluconolactonase [Patescibacteria group bacterium]